MAVGAAVLWDTCGEAACLGARMVPDGPCLAHASVEELAEHLSHEGPVDLDGRGVRFSRGSWGRVLDAVPADEEGRRQLGTVSLDQARFDHEVSFDEVTFAGPVSMVGTLFRSEARFGEATFAAPADFSETDFEGQAWFVEAFFEAPVSFRGARFQGATFFQRASFAAAASFDDAVFSTAATITRATFYDASFRGTVFQGHAHFDGSTCTAGWRLDGARFRLEGEGPELPLEATAEVNLPEPALPLADARPRKTKKEEGLLRRVAARVGAALLVVAFLGALLFIVARPEGATSDGFKDYAFLHVNGRTGKPTRFNPCEPVKYMVNLAGSPRGAEEALEQAFAEVSKATGMTFVNEGSTSETVRLNLPEREEQILGPPERTVDFAANYRHVFNRPSYQPELYGERWAPVLIAWSAFEELGVEYSRSILGVGGSDPRDSEDGRTSAYVSGVAVFNTSAAFLDLKATIMHELGHVVGLAHAGSGDQLMFSSDRDVFTFGSGDLEGLRLLGREAGCVRVPEPQ